MYALADELRLSLAELPGVTVHDVGVERCGIVSFTVDGVTPADMQAALGARGINVNVSRTPSTRLHMENRGLGELMRASVHYYNTCEELATLCTAVRDIGSRR